MYSILLFFIASVISFLGSMQAGPLNLYVLNTALNKNRQTAIYVAIGGIIPEIIYCSLALIALSQVNQFQFLMDALKMIFAVVLLIFAGILWFKKSKTTDVVTPTISNDKSPILKSVSTGFVIAGFNPQLFPFWLFVLISLDASFDCAVVSLYEKVSFCLGTAFGAFCLQYMLILLSEKFSARLKKIVAYKYFYKIIAVFFVCIFTQLIVQHIYTVNHD